MESPGVNKSLVARAVTESAEAPRAQRDAPTPPPPVPAVKRAREPGERRDGFRKGLVIFLFLFPFLACFFLFVLLPVIVAVGLSFTNFDSVKMPGFVGFNNYIALFTQDEIFMQFVIPNTVVFSLAAGFIGYFMAFIVAWMLAQITKYPRIILALLAYSPSLTAGVAMQVVWTTIFSGDPNGYLNALLLELGLITQEIQWLQDSRYLLLIMVAVTVWSSMGVGFLAMLSGILNIDQQLYEAAYVDGMKNRVQEILFVTIPSMKPQMLFGAVMAVVTTFQAGAIGVQLSGANPTPNYAGQLILNHIEDYAYIRYEMGYASAVSTVLLLLIYGVSKVIRRLLADKT